MKTAAQLQLEAEKKEWAYLVLQNANGQMRGSVIMDRFFELKERRQRVGWSVKLA